MTGWIYLIGTIILVGMVIHHFFDEATQRDIERQKKNNPTLDVEGPRRGPWAYFADAIHPRKFKTPPFKREGQEVP